MSLSSGVPKAFAQGIKREAGEFLRTLFSLLVRKEQSRHCPRNGK